MTTIPERPEPESEPGMDEFFDFEDASHQLDGNHLKLDHLDSGLYDVNLAFAPSDVGGTALDSSEQFPAPENHQVNKQNGMTDTTMMGAADFTDFPRWIEGMKVPIQSCAYCRRMRIHCKIINEGIRKGSCTSCVALARSCNLSHPNPVPYHDAALSAPGFFFSTNIADDPDNADDMVDPFGPALPDPCDTCRAQGLQCHPVRKDNRIYTCSNCVSFACSCSLSNDGMRDIMAGINAAPILTDTTEPLTRTGSRPGLVSLKSSEENLNSGTTDSNAKVGARFSRDSIRILRGWLSTHASHPYPTEDEKEGLRRQTGLSKIQITNWLANARRRGKVRAPRSTSPSVRNDYANGVDIPRRSTPALENMNPLERWKNSPPEHEAASVAAIANAVSTYSSGRESPSTYNGHTDDGSNHSICNVSSASSLGTSHGTSHSSGGSFASAFSHKSRGSFGSFGSFGSRGRRRRRKVAPKAVKVTPAAGPPRTFQCTFCTETFKTKHDWQRHEKSLHLSLERWVCCPDGPTQFCADYGHNRCVFCGLPNPPAEHAEEHNYSSCTDRSLEERTFYRKDHLRQHLNLVHDVKFQNFSMETWKVATPEIRSRCGFCGIIMDSWSFRVDHLAEHFKGGKSMADWKGDWGFETPVLDLVENGMPPYLIHDERNSMNPYEASREAPADERTLEDLVKLGLVEYIHSKAIEGGAPTDDELLQEARKIIHTADQFLPAADNPTWFRDLIMLTGTTEDDSLEENIQYSKVLEIASARIQESRNINHILCGKQRALMSFVEAKQALGLIPTDRELQIECCKILDEIEAASNFKCKGAVGWFKWLVTDSSCWLEAFRRRCGLPRSSEMRSEEIRSMDETSIDYSIHNHARLEREMREWVRFQLASGSKPTDAELQSQARMIVYQNDDPWNQTAIDDPAILHLFKRQNGLAPMDQHGAHIIDLPTLNEGLEVDRVCVASPQTPRTLHWDLDDVAISLTSLSPLSGTSSKRSSITPILAATPTFDRPLQTLVSNQPSCNTNPVQPLKYFLNDANCYGRLVRELTRFVKTCMSPNNPNQQIPSDALIQNQARWIIYDDDDPWNQTAADNAEWLIRFKRDVGLAPREDGPGLPDATKDIQTWRVEDDGTGFSPPYICPKDPKAVTEFNEDVPVVVKGRVYKVKAKTAESFLESMQQRQGWEKPAQVFCSRELEAGLNELVREDMANGSFPADDVLRSKAREILGLQQTSADDPHLLEKFKAMHGFATTSTPSHLGDSIPQLAMTDHELLAQFDEELDGMDLTNVDLELPSMSLSSSLDLMDVQSPAVYHHSSGSSNQFSQSSHSMSASPPGVSLLSQGLAAASSGMTNSGVPFNSSTSTFHHQHTLSPGMTSRVSATASPLRRRASARWAAKGGKNDGSASFGNQGSRS